MSTDERLPSVRQEATASGNGRVQQAAGDQYNVHVAPARAFSTVVAVLALLVLLADSGGERNAPADPGDPALIETAGGELTTRSGGGDAPCVVFTPATVRVVLDRCEGGASEWRMSRYSDGYVRFDIPPHENTCLGMGVDHHQRKIVGSWNCGDYNSSWRLEPRPDGYYRLHNRLAESKKWAEECLTHEGTTLRLGPCQEHDAYRWRFPVP
ncbi:hypothetical protein AB0A69_11850 [Streptomyces sp. NPDC045431]|uniref:RICIN domain-containing protein n=1 Tax=Streptomyces sp. NPDC045431 TaxID=3155613 RepID=UPI0033C7CC29